MNNYFHLYLKRHLEAACLTLCSLSYRYLNTIRSKILSWYIELLVAKYTVIKDRFSMISNNFTYDKLMSKKKKNK